MIEAVAAWISTGGDEKVALRVLCSAMSPDFGDAFSDPGSGKRFTMRFGLLLTEELTELQGLWDRVLELVASFGSVAWKHLLDLVRDWAYPNPQIQGVERQIGIMRRLAGRLLSDIARISDGHPGVLHQVSESARMLDRNIEVSLDAEFETLFPADKLEEDYRSSWERQAAAVRELADRWSVSNPKRVARRIRELEDAAADVGLRHPRHTRLLCEEIAERTARPGDWLRALLDERAAGELVTPFLDRAARANEEGWEEVARSLLRDPSLKHVTVSVALTLPNPPSQLLSAVQLRQDGLDNLVEWNSAVGRIPKGTITRLLEHDDVKISAAAALGEWRADPKGSVRSDLYPTWRAAILASDADGYELGDVLKEDPSLAHEWLLRRVEDATSVGLYRLEHIIAEVVPVLNREQRFSVLRALRRPAFEFTSLALQLVFALLSVVVFSAIALFSGVLGDRLSRNPRYATALLWLTGCVMVGLGLRLALSGRH